MSQTPVIPIAPFSAMKRHTAICTIHFFQPAAPDLCSGGTKHDLFGTQRSRVCSWQGVTFDPNNMLANINQYYDMLQPELLLYRKRISSEFFKAHQWDGSGSAGHPIPAAQQQSRIIKERGDFDIYLKFVS